MEYTENRLLRTLKVSTICAGTGPCTLCSCTAYADDGSGLSRCKCGDRKMDHRDPDQAASVRQEELTHC